ncbi:MAG: leucine-rich repeat protein [Clostridia bacterium]|nr:leucine-rich repeat protein [Clostridia bacterium]
MFTRCFGCMRELPVPDEPCPHCGYDRRAATFNRNHLPPGSVLCDRYVIGQALGLGSFGITYIGWDEVGQMRVTIKEFMPSAFAHHRAGDDTVQFYSPQGRALFEKGLRRFGEETAALRRLTQTECISEITDYVETNGTGYAVMEYLSGQTLKARLAQCRTMSFDEAMEILAPVLRTLDEVHRNGLLHRDISPDNIFLCSDGRVKLLDFGSAQFELMQDSPELSVVLKHGYAPPEQYVNYMLAGPWTDVFGAAATLYKMLTGIVPPDAMQRIKDDTLQKPDETGCALPQQVQKALLRALSLRPEDRYPTADAFLQALQPDEETEPNRKKRLLPIIASVVVLLAVVIVAVIALSGRNKPPQPHSQTGTSAAAETTTESPQPLDVQETYYDGFTPEQMAPVYTSSGAQACIPYAVFRQNGRLGLVASDGTVVLPATRSSIVWDEKQQLLLLDGAVYWDAQNNAPATAAVQTVPQGVPDLSDSSYAFADVLCRVTAGGERFPQNDLEGAFLVGGPPYGIAVRGSLLVEQTYEKATPLCCGVSALYEDGKWTYRNAYGVDLFGRMFDGSIFPDGTPYSFSEGYVPVYDEETGLWGYADTAGNSVVEPRYSAALPPVHGTAWVQTERGFGTLRFGDSDRIGGKCGENAQYSYDPMSGVLQISGYGNLWDFTAENVPWLLFRRQIRTVQIDSGIAYLGANCFADCTALSSVTLPMDVQSIGPFAFRGCGMLRMLNLPATVVSIGDEAFAGCSELVEIMVPASLQSLGVCVFRGCTALQDVTFAASAAVPDWTFYGCASMTHADLSAASAIGSHAFEGCISLQTVQLPVKCGRLGLSAFCGCALLENVRIPLGVTTIEASTFRDCTALKAVVLPDGLRTIGQEAFSGCTALGGLSLPPTLTHIGTRAFYNCRGMQNVLVPDSVSRIDAFAFAGCTGIASFDLKDTVQTLGTHVFDGWTARQKIYLKNPLLKRWLGTPSGWDDNWNAGCYAVITAA